MKKFLAPCSVTALVLAVLLLGICADSYSASPLGGGNDNKNSYFNSFQPIFPGAPLGEDEMRITFFGTTCIPMLSQAAVSVLVELGNGEHFMFDAGSGVTPKYYAMGHNLGEMDKIFLAHLHADHMGELPFIFGFGPYFGRYNPLYIWGPGPSNFIYTAHQPWRGPFADGTKSAMDALVAFTVWHTESQSFVPTTYDDYSIPGWCTWSDCSKKDMYEIVTKELDWTKTGFTDANGNSVPGSAQGTRTNDNIAYCDSIKGVKITHFPAVHTRAGSVSYKLEWESPSGPLSMIYAGDTLPNNYMINNASGVDVLIHEIVMPASVWNQKLGVPASQDQGAQAVQDSSHTPQKAFGYILSQLDAKPRLAVGTHFQATDDTIKAALSDVRLWYPKGDVVIASDFMVITVSKTKMDVRRGVVSEHAWPPYTPVPYTSPEAPKYHSPTAQLDPNQDAQVIDPAIYNAR